MSEQEEHKRCYRCDGIGRVPVHLSLAGICPTCHGNGWVSVATRKVADHG